MEDMAEIIEVSKEIPEYMLRTELQCIVSLQNRGLISTPLDEREDEQLDDRAIHRQRILEDWA